MTFNGRESSNLTAKKKVIETGKGPELKRSPTSGFDLCRL